MKIPTVGQTVFSLNVGNAARHQPQVLTPVAVTKVGRKYFTAGEGWRATKYHLETWIGVTEYGPTSKAYDSEQAWLDEKERIQLGSFLRETFSGYGQPPSYLTLQDLREIRGIISAAHLTKP